MLREDEIKWREAGRDAAPHPSIHNFYLPSLAADIFYSARPRLALFILIVHFICFFFVCLTLHLAAIVCVIEEILA